MHIACRFRGGVAVGLFLLTIVFTATAKYSGGTGEPNDPYQITTAADLIALGEDPNDYSKHFKLMTDIDLSGFDGKDGRPAFNVIGDCYTWTNGISAFIGGTPFAGVFDGNGNTISHLTALKANGDFRGLFGGVGQGAQVKNLRVLVDVNISGTEGVVGALAGYNGGTVTRCSSEGAVTGKGWMTVGGLVGLNWGGAITDCHSTAVVSGGNGGTGGLLGRNSHRQLDRDRQRGRVSQCYSAGRVSGNLDVGGLVGSNTGEVVASFWDTQTSGLTASGGGTGKTTAEMQAASTFSDAGWDFVGETANGVEDIWWIDEGKDYPRLWWEKYSGGSGTADDPYQIATAADLIALGERPEDYDKHFVLTADIDLDPNLPGRKVFDRALIAPDVNDLQYNFQGTAFTGTFDGGGHTIRHLAIADPNHDYLGLFGMIAAGARVSNLALVNVDISGGRHSIDVGTLAGYNAGTLAECSATGIAVGCGNVRELAGSNSGTIINCHADVRVSWLCI